MKRFSDCRRKLVIAMDEERPDVMSNRTANVVNFSKQIC